MLLALTERPDIKLRVIHRLHLTPFGRVVGACRPPSAGSAAEEARGGGGRESAEGEELLLG